MTRLASNRQTGRARVIPKNPGGSGLSRGLSRRRQCSVCIIFEQLHAERLKGPSFTLSPRLHIDPGVHWDVGNKKVRVVHVSPLGVTVAWVEVLSQPLRT